MTVFNRTNRVSWSFEGIAYGKALRSARIMTSGAPQWPQVHGSVETTIFHISPFSKGTAAGARDAPRRAFDFYISVELVHVLSFRHRPTISGGYLQDIFESSVAAVLLPSQCEGIGFRLLIKALLQIQL